MSRFCAMDESDTSTKSGVGETVAVVSLAIQIAKNLKELGNLLNTIIQFFTGKKNTERKIIVQVLSRDLDNIKDTIDNLQFPEHDENIVLIQSYLELMVKTAKNLKDRLSHHKAVQVVDVLKNGTFDTQVGKLRTGLADISNVLKPYQHGASHPQTVSQYYHPHMPASTSAPPQVVYNHYENNNYHINGMTGSNDYVDAISRLDQAQALNHARHNPRIASHQQHVVAYPPMFHR